MTALHPPLKQPAAQAGAYLRLAPALFAITLFLSALLLFAVQPMFTKMVLPRLGGAPTVWSVAMVFFQAALLAGYAYAHLLIRFLPLGLGALVHLAILAAAAMTLPIGIALGFGAPPTSNIAIWLIGLFAVSIGLPFAALSASAPLLQGWFAASGHPQSGNPYVLYAASNLGSFAALIAYPVVIEPLLSLNRQVQMWSVGFAVPGDPDRGDRALHRAPAKSHAGSRSGGAGIDPRPPCLGCAVRDTGRPRHRGHVLHDDRCCGGAVSLGAAARALSADLRGRVPRPPVDPAPHRGNAGAVRGRAAGGRAARA